MSSNEMVGNDNPFAWAWELGTEQTAGEGLNRLDTLANDDPCRTAALSHAGYDGAYQAGPSSGRSLGLNGPTGLLDSNAASAEPDLVSGCRVIEKKEPRSRRKEHPKELHGQRYVCLWTPCESKNPTFGRPAELQRHYIDKHLRPEVYRCTALVRSKLCGKEYYRPDKFRYHMVTDHPVETEFPCPIDLCEAGPYTFDLLCIHVSSHDQAVIRSTLGFAKSCYVDRGFSSLSCPVKGCNKRMPPTYLRYHLYCHDPNTRYCNREAIRGAGHCEITGHALCPICRVNIDLEVEHVHIEETASTLWLWPVTLHMYRVHWHEPEMLHKHRRDILKIDPDFASHPFSKDKVFKDVLPTMSAKE